MVREMVIAMGMVMAREMVMAMASCWGIIVAGDGDGDGDGCW